MKTIGVGVGILHYAPSAQAVKNPRRPRPRRSISLPAVGIQMMAKKTLPTTMWFRNFSSPLYLVCFPQCSGQTFKTTEQNSEQVFPSSILHQQSISRRFRHYLLAQANCPNYENMIPGFAV
jgi:hypothetical protein